ncbi:hypothetical protein LSCM1_03279 [Leishmania martiniquensis]|uniref:DUF676 domain-containing protein n=1 Tax=Leishmania martiniquensis TaxID=1580590 RepID=A0A836HD18_9TRYP|nr:hypothetical protein LSCM1_03279 [Leishmania martiniquensis]
MNPIGERPPSQTEARPSSPLCSLYFVLFHQGYHGKASEFKYWCKIRSLLRQGSKTDDTGAEDSSPSSPAQKYVLITPVGNDSFGADSGVMTCGCRFAVHVCAVVALFVAKELGIGAAPSCPTTEATPDAADGAATRRRPRLCFSAVGHSMGGLVLRAAMPRIMETIEGIYGKPPYDCEICWDVFCTLSTPHLGVRYMWSCILTCLAGCLGSLLSKSLRDMFLQDDVLTRVLVSPPFLCAWSRFGRRVLLCPVNDNTVLSYSSGFTLTLRVRNRVGAPLTKEERTRLKAFCEAEAKQGRRYRDPNVAHLASCGVRCATTLKELCTNGVVLKQLLSDLWPPGVLPMERELAAIILGRVGPLELHFVDFRPNFRCVTSAAARHQENSAGGGHKLGPVTRETMRRGTFDSSHTAMMCMGPFFYPDIFGFVPKFVLGKLLCLPLCCATLVLPADGPISCSCMTNCDEYTQERRVRIQTECC